MRKPKYPYQLVEVRWLDAMTTDGWEVEEDAKADPPVAITVGFLIKETDAALLLASTVCDDKMHNGRIVIPAGMVKERRNLK